MHSPTGPIFQAARDNFNKLKETISATSSTNVTMTTPTTNATTTNTTTTNTTTTNTPTTTDRTTNTTDDTHSICWPIGDSMVDQCNQ